MAGDPQFASLAFDVVVDADDVRDAVVDQQVGGARVAVPRQGRRCRR